MRKATNISNSQLLNQQQLSKPQQYSNTIKTNTYGAFNSVESIFVINHIQYSEWKQLFQLRATRAK